MKVKVFLINDEEIAGEGTADEMGITVQKRTSIVVAGKENEATMILIPWKSVRKFEYIVSEDMIQKANEMAQQDQPHAILDEPVAPNRAARRAALKNA